MCEFMPIEQFLAECSNDINDSEPDSSQELDKAIELMTEANRLVQEVYYRRRGAFFRLYGKDVEPEIERACSAVLKANSILLQKRFPST